MHTAAGPSGGILGRGIGSLQCSKYPAGIGSGVGGSFSAPSDPGYGKDGFYGFIGNRRDSGQIPHFGGPGRHGGSQKHECPCAANFYSIRDAPDHPDSLIGG